MKKTKIFVITGLSGSGKTTAINAIEDAGFFCIDNLPVVLLPKFLELRRETDSVITKFALVMDMREKGFLHNYQHIFSKLKEEGYLFEIIFLETSKEVLLRRYSQTRRKHPLSDGGGTIKGIEKEIEELKELRGTADLIIDTSNYNVHELKEVVLNHLKKAIPERQMIIYILSFGFKYGIPHDADIVIDVRFLPNPYFVQRLKNLDGTHEEVRKYIEKWEETKIFLDKYLDLLKYMIPLYKKEGKTSLTIAIGCTAGIHRSVSIAELIYRDIKRKTKYVNLTHRDIELDR
ncbi:MAG: RNase adapter RapZ [Deltaproteobacteria bacterium]|nr:RNase adapter RapZ [Deltaproteobacteria bacterium]